MLWLLLSGGVLLVIAGVHFGRWAVRLGRVGAVLVDGLGVRSKNLIWQQRFAGEHDGVPFEVWLSPLWFDGDLYSAIWAGERDSVRGATGQRLVSFSLSHAKDEDRHHRPVVPLDGSLIFSHSKYDDTETIAELCRRPNVIAAAESVLASGTREAQVFGARVFVHYGSAPSDPDEWARRVACTVGFWRALTAAASGYR